MSASLRFGIEIKQVSRPTSSNRHLDVWGVFGPTGFCFTTRVDEKSANQYALQLEAELEAMILRRHYKVVEA